MNSSALLATDDLREAYGELSWKDQYSPHNEAIYAGLISFAVHFFAVVILPLIFIMLSTPDMTPPPVATVSVIDLQDTVSPDPLTGLDSTPELKQTADPKATQTTPPQSMEKLNDVKPVEMSTTAVDSATKQLQQDLAKTQAKTSAKVSETAALIENAKNQLSDALANNTSDGGAGKQGRAARWLILFEYENGREILEQYESLGAELAVPLPGDRWQFFDNLTSSPLTSSIRDLTSESRIYWVSDDPTESARIAQALGLGTAPMVVMFLPQGLEDRMLQMELAYNGPKSENDIAQTRFGVVQSGDRWDLVVTGQTLK